MDMSKGPAAPASGTDDIPSFEELAADPEIAALLDFEPAPVRRRVNGWDPDAQRALVALIAVTGSKGHAAAAIGRRAAGLERIFDRDGGAPFKSACDDAFALHRRRNGVRLAQEIAAAAGRDSRRWESATAWAKAADEPSPGEVLNDHGEYEDEDSYRRRGEDARDSIAGKLLRIRRLYLQEISACPGKRAAFEILTELPVDWELAEQLEPQPFEPWTRTNQHQPDMVLTADSGWGLLPGYGPDKRAELRAAIDEYRASEGLEPVDWSESESTERSEQARSAT